MQLRELLDVAVRAVAQPVHRAHSTVLCAHVADPIPWSILAAHRSLSDQMPPIFFPGHVPRLLRQLETFRILHWDGIVTSYQAINLVFSHLSEDVFVIVQHVSHLSHPPEALETWEAGAQHSEVSLRGEAR